MESVQVQIMMALFRGAIAHFCLLGSVVRTATAALLPEVLTAHPAQHTHIFLQHFAQCCSRATSN